MTTNTLPPQASRAGKNRYYHRCEAVDSSRHYGVCLFTIEAFERGQKLNETPCVAAMRDGSCPAMAMRQQELDAGQALYFKAPDPVKAVDPKDAQRERERVNTQHPSYQRGFSGDIRSVAPSESKSKKKPTIAKPAPKKTSGDEMLEFDASKIVNKLIDEERTEETIKQEMLVLSRPAAVRKKQALERGETPKPSVFDYMTANEKKQFDQLKRELVSLKMKSAA